MDEIELLYKSELSRHFPWDTDTYIHVDRPINNVGFILTAYLLPIQSRTGLEVLQGGVKKSQTGKPAFG